MLHQFNLTCCSLTLASSTPFWLYFSLLFSLSISPMIPLSNQSLKFSFFPLILPSILSSTLSATAITLSSPDSVAPFLAFSSTISSFANSAFPVSTTSAGSFATATTLGSVSATTCGFSAIIDYSGTTYLLFPPFPDIPETPILPWPSPIIFTDHPPRSPSLFFHHQISPPVVFTQATPLAPELVQQMPQSFFSCPTVTAANSAATFSASTTI